jgi:uncharacterized protein (TIGR02266 family)
MGFTENLSGGGVFIATHLIRPIGSSVEVNLSLPGTPEPLVLHGEVRWVREYNSSSSDVWPGMGIRFEDLGQEQEALIRQFLQTREPLFFTD